MAAAVIGWLTLSGGVAAAASNITYSASGTFAAVPMSGTDTFKLAGQPFNINVVVSSATVPFKTGSNWAAYNKLRMTGQITSGLLSTPVSIASNQATIIQAISPGKFDQFTIEAPLRILGLSITIKAVVIMPIGTITRPLLQPFTAPVSMAPSNATMTYNDSNANTELAIQSGTLNAK
ncbi:MAG TPA: hypothetical protein VMI94_19755 [Bryobacteraceae bacterium]|nr:hypothetical protein [Bryobacteraceae bacterium]